MKYYLTVGAYVHGVHSEGQNQIKAFQKMQASNSVDADMEFVKNFTHLDFQAKSFTPQKCVICDSFFGN